VLPPEGIDGLLLMRHEHATHAPGKLLEIRTTAPSPALVLPYTPEAFQGIEMVTASGGQELPPQASLPRGERRRQRVRPGEATALDDHHPRFPGGGKAGHHWMDRVPKPLGIPLRDDLIEDLGGPLVDRTNDPEPDPAGAPAPGARASPGLAFEGLLTLALPLRQGARGEAGARGRAVPPAGAGQGKAPQERCVGIAQEDGAPTGLVRKRCQCDRGVGEGRRVGRKQSGGTLDAHRLFFQTPRPLSRSR
jgi:hypothetical protein